MSELIPEALEAAIEACDAAAKHADEFASRAMIEAAIRAYEAAKWRKGDDGARSGDLIQAAFSWTHIATGYVGWQYVIVAWDHEGGRWVDSEGDVFTETNELPEWYRPFVVPPAIAAPPSEPKT